MTEVLDTELENLKSKCGLNDWYGALLAVKDSYEILIKFSCLVVCALSCQKNDDHPFFKLLTSPEHPMSLGDWTNDLLNAVRNCEYVKQDDDLKAYFKALVKLINTTRIVTWRNDTLGHGVMKFSPDEQMISEIQEKKDRIFGFAAAQQDVLARFNSFCDGDRRNELSPFLLWDGDDMLFFDSMERDGSCKYLDLTNRKRVRKNESFWREKRRMFYGDLNVSDRTAPLDCGYSADLDTMLAAFHKSQDYEAADYLRQCVKQWLKDYPGGSFLLTADRGTGKSAFVYACDELQHNKGSQRIKLSDHTSTVAVRSYYASRTEMLSPDEAEEHIIELLKNGPDGSLIRLRGSAGKPVSQMSFREKVGALFQYYRSGGVDKVVIFIDGIDELTGENAGALRCIPDSRNPLEEIYFIFTCRSIAEGIPAAAISFCEKTVWTDIRVFDRKAENADLLRTYIAKHVDNNPDMARRLAERMDYRFSTVSLLPYMSREDIQSLLSDSARADNRTVLSKYLERLRCCYGSAYFHRMVRIAVIVAETPGEALSMQEVAWLAEDHALTSREVAFFYDLRPLLMEFRDYRGAVYGISNIGWVEVLRELYPDILKEIALDWEEDLLAMDPKAEGAYPEAKWNALLYEASALIGYFERLCLHPGNERLFDEIILVATRFHQGYQSHVLFRSLRCYSSLLQIYGRSLQKAYSADAMVKFLAIFNTCGKQYADLHQEQQLLMIAESVEEMIGKYQIDWEKDITIALQVLSFYNNMICLCGEQYLLEIGESYYKKGQSLYMKLREEQPECIAALNEIWSSLFNNAFSMLRYDHPEKALEMAEPLLEDMRKWQYGYRDVNTGCSVAMCYMSFGDVLSAFRLLKECMARLEQLPPPQNPYENEIYIVTTWRYCQRVHEAYGQTGVSIEDIEKARGFTNQIMNYIISVESAGYPDLSRWKPQIAMTEALICGRLAEIKSRTDHLSDEVRELLSEAVKICDYVAAIYNDWDKHGVEYDRVSAMHNSINIGAVYAEAGMPSEGIRTMENALQRYLPKNHTEQKVQQMILRKIDEIKEHFKIKQ